MDITTQQIAELETLIKRSFTTLLIGHSSPDPDALSSLIALKTLLEKSYSKSDVIAVAESIPLTLDFIPGYSSVLSTSALSVLQEKSVDLVIMLDFNQWHMSSKLQAEAIKGEIQKQGIPLVLIDHHEPVDKNIDADLYFRIDSTSTAGNLFTIFHELIENTITDYEAQHLLYGIIGDTNRFKFSYGESQAPILKKAALLQEVSTLSIEELSTKMESYTLDMMKIVGALLNHMTSDSGKVTYTAISHAEFEALDLNRSQISNATNYLALNIITNIDQIGRGFILYPHFQDENTFTVRFRSNSKLLPVNHWAAALGGGGHTQSAATRVHAASVEEAVSIVLSIVNKED